MRKSTDLCVIFKTKIVFIRLRTSFHFLLKTFKEKIKVIKEYKRSIYKSFGVIKYIQKVMGLRGHLSVTNNTTTLIEKTVVIA